MLPWCTNLITLGLGLQHHLLFTIMDDQRVHEIAALIQQQNHNLFNLYQVLEKRRRRRKRRRQRALWFRGWIVRRTEFGVCDQLIVELRNEGPRAFHYFIGMPPAMFDELEECLRPRLTKPRTNVRPNLDPGLKMALTVRPLAFRSTYRNMQYAWRVPQRGCPSLVDLTLQESDLCNDVLLPVSELDGGLPGFLEV